MTKRTMFLLAAIILLIIFVKMSSSNNQLKREESNVVWYSLSDTAIKIRESRDKSSNVIGKVAPFEIINSMSVKTQGAWIKLFKGGKVGYVPKKSFTQNKTKYQTVKPVNYRKPQKPIKIARNYNKSGLGRVYFNVKAAKKSGLGVLLNIKGSPTHKEMSDVLGALSQKPIMNTSKRYVDIPGGLAKVGHVKLRQAGFSWTMIRGNVLTNIDKEQYRFHADIFGKNDVLLDDSVCLVERSRPGKQSRFECQAQTQEPIYYIDFSLD